MTTPLESPATIVHHRRVSDAFRLLTLELPSPPPPFTPGQFCMISVPDPSRILRRPFSIYDLRHNRLTILYKIAGEGTRRLAELRPGQRLSTLLPLGNGFPTHTFHNKTLYCVSGGVGFASLHPLTRIPTRRTVFLAGFRSAADLFPFPKTSRLRLHIATEDGSRGFHGRVTDLTLHILTTNHTDPASTVVCACGPAPMLKTLVHTLQPFNLPLYTSLEERMACGLGLCMGCTVPTTSGHRRSCVDGPVFPAHEIDWNHYG